MEMYLTFISFFWWWEFTAIVDSKMKQSHVTYISQIYPPTRPLFQSSIHPFIHPSRQSSIHPLISSSTHPASMNAGDAPPKSTQDRLNKKSWEGHFKTFALLVIHSLILPITHSSTPLSTCIHRIAHPSTHGFIHPSIRSFSPSNHPFIHAPMIHPHPFIQSPAHHPSVHPLIHSPTHPFTTSISSSFHPLHPHPFSRSSTRMDRPIQITKKPASKFGR